MSIFASNYKLKADTYEQMEICVFSVIPSLLTKMPLRDLLLEQKEEETTEGKYQQLCLNFDG